MGACAHTHPPTWYLRLRSFSATVPRSMGLGMTWWCGGGGGGGWRRRGRAERGHGLGRVRPDEAGRTRAQPSAAPCAPDNEQLLLMLSLAPCRLLQGWLQWGATPAARCLQPPMAYPGHAKPSVVGWSCTARMHACTMHMHRYTQATLPRNVIMYLVVVRHIVHVHRRVEQLAHVGTHQRAERARRLRVPCGRGGGRRRAHARPRSPGGFG